MKLIRLEDVTGEGDYQFSFSATVRTDNPQLIVEISDKLKDGVPYDLAIKRVREKRSLTANAYFWQLIQKLSEKMHVPKEAIYREYIKNVGSFEAVSVSDDAAESFRKLWESHGLGWVTDMVAHTDGHTVLLCYPGSSTYNKAQMSRLIEAVVEDCKAFSIETMTPGELAMLDYGEGGKNE